VKVSRTIYFAFCLALLYLHAFEPAYATKYSDLSPCLQTLRRANAFLYAEKAKAHAQDLLDSHHLPKSYIEGYLTRRINSRAKPTEYLKPEEIQYLYRGVLISVDDLVKILNEGMALKDSSWHAGGVGISFSTDINEAASYIFQSWKENAVGVVFRVDYDEKKYWPLDDLSLNPFETILKTSDKIQPKNISGVYIWSEYGLEPLSKVFEKFSDDSAVPHEKWTTQFDGMNR
jgi:hypothetical protein